MTKARTIVVFCVTLVMIGCSSVSVYYDFDPEADFSRIQSYKWLPISKKAKGDKLTIKNIKFAVNKQLKAKGLQKTSDSPDMLIALHLTKEKHVDTQEYGYSYGTGYYHGGPYGRGPYGEPYREGPYGEPYGTDMYHYQRGIDRYEYEIGTLILDFVDAQSKELIWRGTATGVIDPYATSEDVYETVAKILENFPPLYEKK